MSLLYLGVWPWFQFTVCFVGPVFVHLAVTRYFLAKDDTSLRCCSMLFSCNDHPRSRWNQLYRLLGVAKIITGSTCCLSESCLAETSNLESSKGPYNWPFTRSGETASVPCANGPSMVNATRKCNGDFSMGAFWGDVLDPNCNFNSKRTEELNSLSEVCVS